MIADRRLRSAIGFPESGPESQQNRRSAIGNPNPAYVLKIHAGINEIYPEDYGNAVCFYEFFDDGAEDWAKPFQSGQALLDQLDESRRMWLHQKVFPTQCTPKPFPDGTPHYLEMIWKNLTDGRPFDNCRQLQADEGNREARNALARLSEGRSCRGFESAALQAEALSDTRPDTGLSMAIYPLSFSVVFKKCQNWLTVLAKCTSLTILFSNFLLVIAVLVSVVWRSLTKADDRARLFSGQPEKFRPVVPSPHNNALENAFLKKRVAKLEAYIADHLDKKSEDINDDRITGGRGVGEYGALGSSTAATGAFPSSGNANVGGVAREEDKRETSVERDTAGPLLATPLRRRRASTDVEASGGRED